MIWQLVDRETGAENADITWAFRVGDRVKIRLANEMDQDHPMHHPFHIHGAGRFLVLSRDGEPEENLVWKDTVLLRAGQTIDILLDVTNPGLWMAHCHIAEHTESGMMFSFDVAPAESRARPGSYAGSDECRRPTAGTATHADVLGCRRRSRAGSHAPCHLVVGLCDGLRARARCDRCDLRRIRGRRRTTERNRH